MGKLDQAAKTKIPSYQLTQASKYFISPKSELFGLSRWSDENVIVVWCEKMFQPNWMLQFVPHVYRRFSTRTVTIQQFVWDP